MVEYTRSPRRLYTSILVPGGTLSRIMRLDIMGDTMLLLEEALLLADDEDCDGNDDDSGIEEEDGTVSLLLECSSSDDDDWGGKPNLLVSAGASLETM